MARTYGVNAFWDQEAQVWVATSEDVPGLATEADTMELLVEKLKLMIPELLKANGLWQPDLSEVPFHLISERTEVATAQNG
jgi:predicted RNase H-like HicB family nuclease